MGPKVKYIDESAELASSDDEPSSESDDEARFLQDDLPEVPAEFWHIQKLIKYMKAGNQTATVVALCLLNDYDLENPVNFTQLVVSIIL